MLKVQVLNRSGKKVKEMNAPEEVFGFAPKEHLVYEAVVNYRANLRSGTASTKTRGVVRGGGRKPWRQKGTGRARAGSIRSPLWRSGGVTFGPHPKDFSYRLSKKARKNALKSVLSQKMTENHLLVVDGLDFKEPKTKAGVELLRALNVESALIIDSGENRPLFLSMRNIPMVKAVDVNHINVYDVLNHEWLVMTPRAFESVTERLK